VAGEKIVRFEDLELGRIWESVTRLVTQEEVDAFADLTGDHNPIHVDAEFAKKTPYRRRIAHGMLGMSFVVTFATQTPITQTTAFLGVREWRFLAPLFPGDTIRIRNQVLKRELRGRGRRATVLWQIQLFNQDDKVIQEGVVESIIELEISAISPEANPEKPAT
jgi:acyl dehydratase